MGKSVKNRYNGTMNKNRTRPLRLVWERIAKMDEAYFKTAIEPQGVDQSLDYDYVGDADPMHRLEILRPQDAEGPLPVIVDVHGGGWVYGHKDSYYRYFCMALAKAGYAVISFNYRLAFDHPFPAQIEDIFSLFKWMETHAQEQALDLDNVYLVGDSAGAHLAALSALIQSTPELQQAYRITPAKLTLRALGLSCGVYDFDRLITMPYELPMKELLVETLFNRLDYAAHPLYRYASVSRNLNASLPPVFVISSKSDPLYGESGQLILELRENGLPHKSRVYAKKRELPHVFNLKSVYPESAEVTAEMLRYFAQFKG